MELNTFQKLMASMIASGIQITLDNPITSYRQLIQQYAIDSNGKIIDPLIARQQATQVFMKSPIAASMSGLGPRLFGITFFGLFWSISLITGEKEPSMISAIGSSILYSYLINPIRMIEKQQRVNLKTTGKIKPIYDIIRESKSLSFKPLFRGVTPLIAHSIISTTAGLIIQPKLQQLIQNILMRQSDNSPLFSLSKTSANLIASSIVSPIYVILTNPFTRLEVMMQTNPIKKDINITSAIKDIITDGKKYGFRGIFRGQGVGIAKSIVSLFLFHETRMLTEEIIRSIHR